MAKSYAEHVDPSKVSPKVKTPAAVLTALTALATIAAVFLTAIPATAYEGLGPVWAGPASLAVATLAQILSGYQATDPAREPTLITETVVSAPVAEPDQLVLTEPVATAAVHENDPVARLAAEVA